MASCAHSQARGRNLSALTSAAGPSAGHAFAAVISACAAGGDWGRGAALFDEMRARWGIKPDVVSCTALVTAFGTDGQWARAQQVALPPNRCGHC